MNPSEKNTAPKLKRCPFCGVELELQPPSAFYIHPMNGCLLSARGVIGTEQIEQWNTRYDGWIPMEDHPPEDTDLYLVKRRHGYDLLLFNSAKERRSSHPEHRNHFIELNRHREWVKVDDVTHWLPFSAIDTEDEMEDADENS